MRSLRTHFETPEGVVRAVDGVSFEVGPGRILGLVGESGSGKSVTGFSILGLVEPPGKVVDGTIVFEGRDIRGFDERDMRALRGNRIAMVFQDPMMTLNPVLTIGAHLIETLRAHRAVPRAEAKRLACEALQLVGIPAPAERLDAYPHEFSGGMRQRVAIAIALLHRPALIIADEPTTALDVTIQAQILSEVQRLARSQGTAVIWISHDLAVVSSLADDIAVMYAGRIVERGPARSVLANPAHPYTRGLIGSVPSQNPRGQRLRQIRGMPPRLLSLPAGCAFRDRCDHALPACQDLPDETEVAPGHHVRCVNARL